MFRQGPAYGLVLGLLGGGLAGRRCGRRLGGDVGLTDQRLELGLVEQVELVWGDAVRTGAEALALEERNGVEQLLDLALGFGHTIAQPQHFGVQFDGVFRELGNGTFHRPHFT